jgi:exodeoxyribonuclease V
VTYRNSFSPDQQGALDAITRWFIAARRGLAPQTFFLAGPAGTGKTTIAREVPGLLRASCLFAAFTGKASQVLRSKGCEPASTLHSLIYIRVSTAAEIRLPIVQRQLRAELLDPIMRAQLEFEERELKLQLAQQQWIVNPDSDLAAADLLICDEVSMVNEDVALDLLSFGVPILVLGDPEQLPPVSGGGFFTARPPDYLLTQVHRQAGGSPVLDLATRIREGGRLGPFDRRYLDVASLLDHEQVLCGRRRTRWELITDMRQRLGRPFALPVPGDKLMCLRNDREIGIYNGQLFEVVEVGPGSRPGMHGLQLVSDADTALRINAPAGPFISDAEEREATDGRRRLPAETGLFTFANAITVHKSQGSEWRSVALIDEASIFSRDPDTPRRWLYTGITRASQQISIGSGWNA